MCDETKVILKKKPQSSRYINSKLYIDCAECLRGGNGKRNCPSSWYNTRIGHCGCFNGILMDHFAVPELLNKETP